MDRTSRTLTKILPKFFPTPGDWRRWLSLVLLDERMLELYAARVSGSLVLADHKRELVFALWRHLFRARSRRRALADHSRSTALATRASAS